MRRLIGAAMAAIALASCGVRGDLETPAPMWGEARAKYKAEQARIKAQEAAAAPAFKDPDLTPPSLPAPPSAPTPQSPIHAPPPGAAAP